MNLKHIIILIFAIVLGGLTACSENTSRDRGDTIGVVSMGIYKDSWIKEVKDLDLFEGSTVLDVMKDAEISGKLKFSFTGKGETAFVFEIDNTENEGMNKRNWLLKINDQCAMVSAGILALQPDDKMSWHFAGPDISCD